MRFKHNEIRAAVNRKLSNRIINRIDEYERQDLFNILELDFPDNQFHPSFHCDNVRHKNPNYKNCECEKSDKAIFIKAGRGKYKIK